MTKRSESLAPRFIFSLVALITVTSVFLSGVAVLLERRSQLRSLRSTAASTADYAAAALAYPVWNMIDREIEVLLRWTFREKAVIGVVLRLDDDGREPIAFRRNSADEIVSGFVSGERGDIIEHRKVMFDGRPVALLELRLSADDVERRIRTEAFFIALVVLALDGVLGLALMQILRRTVFRPLARIESWASSLEQSELDRVSFEKTSAEQGEIAGLRSSIERMVVKILTKEREYRSLFENSPISIWELDFSALKARFDSAMQGCEDFETLPLLRDSAEVRKAISLIRVKSVNSVTLEWLGVNSLREIKGGLGALLEEDGIRLFAEELRALSFCSPRVVGECLLRLPSGAVKHFVISFATLAGYENDWSRVMLTAADITDRVRIESQLLVALTQKDVLLKELFHRTRNSLQLIHSMISLREPRMDVGIQSNFQSIRTLVGTISLAQDKLYETEDLSFLDLGSYLRDLLAILGQEYNKSGSRVRLASAIESVPVLIDHAVPLGIFLGELVSNAYLHAFPDGREGTVSVDLRVCADGFLELSVSDDGIGVPPDFDPRKNGGFGLETAVSLGEGQIRGTIEFNLDSGFSCVLRFSLPDDKARV